MPHGHCDSGIWGRISWGALALFLVIAGGTAYAANTIGSADIINGQVKSADIGDNQVQSIDVKNGGLTGADIKDASNVDTCTHGTARLGGLCARVADEHHTWLPAAMLCEDLGLRLPSYGEARVLAANFELPAVADDEFFWTDEYLAETSVFAVDGAGAASTFSDTASLETVCVTTPTN